jgi:hypothetical protein
MSGNIEQARNNKKNINVKQRSIRLTTMFSKLQRVIKGVTMVSKQRTIREITTSSKEQQ